MLWALHLGFLMGILPKLNSLLETSWISTLESSILCEVLKRASPTVPSVARSHLMTHWFCSI